MHQGNVANHEAVAQNARRFSGWGRGHGTGLHTSTAHASSTVLKVLKAVRQWDNLVGHHVIEEFCRNEIETTSTAMNDRQCNLAGVFEDPGPTRTVNPAATSQEQETVAKRNKLLESTQRVKDEKKFVAFTPASEQVLVAELRLLRHLHAHNMWAKANDAWITSFLPVGGLIRIKSAKVSAFVLKTNECAALTWPAEEVARHVWRKSAAISQLEWRVVFSPDDVEVFPTRYWFPLHARLKGLKIHDNVGSESDSFSYS